MFRKAKGKAQKRKQEKAFESSTAEEHLDVEVEGGLPHLLRMFLPKDSGRSLPRKLI